MISRHRFTASLLVALLVATFVIRGPITSVPPVLALVRQDLGLDAVGAGLVTTLPVLCFGVFACVTPILAAKYGLERTLGVALAVLLLGVCVRLVPGVGPFFGGTLAIGAGIAVANVVIPAIARARFAGSLARVMGRYTVMIQVSGACGAFATRPLLDGAGWQWRWVIGIWAVPALLALLWWGSAARARARDTDNSSRVPSVTGMSKVARRPITWGIVLVMGLQSLVFFSLINWLPTLLRDQGWSEVAAGVALGAFSLLGLPGSFLGARILAAGNRRALLIALTLAFIGGLVLLVCGAVAAGIGMLLCGLCQGPALAVALSAIAGQLDPADVPAVSAISQGAGYLLASLGPVTVGALYGLRHDFLLAVVALVAVMVAWGTATVLVGRAQARSLGAPHRAV